MRKLIDFLRMREQINCAYLLTSQGHNGNIVERNKEKKPPNPEVAPFTPQENQSTAQTSSTETSTSSSDAINATTTSTQQQHHCQQQIISQTNRRKSKESNSIIQRNQKGAKKAAYPFNKQKTTTHALR